MQRDSSERRFSRQKHTLGGWRTKRIDSGKFVRYLTSLLSFKHGGIRILGDKSSPAFTVVDFGCGNGALSHYFLDCCPATIIAVDWSPEALLKIPTPRKGRILVLCADVERLPIKDGCIDALFSIDTLGHLCHQNRALDEIGRICRNGAPLFLHSECSDYRGRWPDRLLIRKTGRDYIAEIDGHIGIVSSEEMRGKICTRFTCDRFFSPAGLLGWLIGYPEKYHTIFGKAGVRVGAFCTGMISRLHRYSLIRYAFKTINLVSNHIELHLGITGGGSCFAYARIRFVTSPARPITSPSIDIIIPTYNRESALQPLVGSLLDQCRQQDRIIIVWQGLKKPPIVKHPAVSMIHQSDPNLPAARNTGLHHGNNPVVLYLDDDVSVSPSLLERHRTFHQTHKNCAAVGKIIDPLFPEAETPSRFDSTTGELIQSFSLQQSSSSLSVMGANMSFSRFALERIVGFDTAFRGNALWEEIDVSFRLHHAGFPIFYCAEAAVTHHRSPQGGCRTDTGASYLHNLFANTAYFACTYAPLKHLPTWFSFWKNRLEYLSRKYNTPDHHEPLLVSAGMTGVVHGIFRFLHRGKRRGLPEVVYDTTCNRPISR